MNDVIRLGDATPSFTIPTKLEARKLHHANNWLELQAFVPTPEACTELAHLSGRIPPGRRGRMLMSSYRLSLHRLAAICFTSMFDEQERAPYNGVTLRVYACEPWNEAEPTAGRCVLVLDLGLTRLQFLDALDRHDDLLKMFDELVARFGKDGGPSSTPEEDEDDEPWMRLKKRRAAQTTRGKQAQS